MHFIFCWTLSFVRPSIYPLAILFTHWAIIYLFIHHLSNHPSIYSSISSSYLTMYSLSIHPFIHCLFIVYLPVCLYIHFPISISTCLCIWEKQPFRTNWIELKSPSFSLFLPSFPVFFFLSLFPSSFLYSPLYKLLRELFLPSNPGALSVRSFQGMNIKIMRMDAFLCIDTHGLLHINDARVLKLELALCYFSGKIDGQT